jgi:ABC-type transporter lipoprotein component MlaA
MVIFGAIAFALSRKNSVLTETAKEAKAKQELADTLAKKEEAKTDAEKAEDAYKLARDAFYRDSGSSGV